MVAKEEWPSKKFVVCYASNLSCIQFEVIVFQIVIVRGRNSSVTILCVYPRAGSATGMTIVWTDQMKISLCVVGSFFFFVLFFKAFVGATGTLALRMDMLVFSCFVEFPVLFNLFTT